MSGIHDWIQQIRSDPRFWIAIVFLTFLAWITVLPLIDQLGNRFPRVFASLGAIWIGFILYSCGMPIYALVVLAAAGWVIYQLLQEISSLRRDVAESRELITEVILRSAESIQTVALLGQDFKEVNADAFDPDPLNGIHILRAFTEICEEKGSYEGRRFLARMSLAELRPHEKDLNEAALRILETLIKERYGDAPRPAAKATENIFAPPQTSDSAD